MAKATKKTSSSSTAKPRAQASPAKAATPPVVMSLTHDQIARKAYEIWLAKGRPLGQDEQNWSEAQAALNGGVKV